MKSTFSRSHLLNEHPQAIIGIVHHILVNVRNDPKPQRPVLDPFFGSWPRRKPAKW